MKRVWLMSAYWGLTALAFAGAVGMVFAWTPEEQTMGIIQKVFYVHLPIAINTFLACTVVCVAGVGYLATRRTWWDDLAAAGAKVAVVLCSLVLATGMLWGRGAWNAWWTWSPRLTFSLMLWLLFVVYLIVRASVEGSQRRAAVSAVYGIIAYLDVPLVYLSTRLLPDIHPGNIALAPSMKLTLAACFVPVTLMAAGMIVLQFQVHRAARIESDTRLHGFEVLPPHSDSTGGAA
jgi:heme exporter protein C